jgi:hypothetical protein
MTRPTVLAAIVTLSIATLVAEEPAGNAWAPPAAGPPPVVFDDGKITSGNVLWKDPQAQEDANAKSVSFLFTGHESALAGGNESCGCSEFHCVASPGCRIGFLDPWCGCETSCCTTDQWCCHPCSCSHGNCYLNEEGCWVCNDAWCDVQGRDFRAPFDPLRFGWWGVSADGSPVKTGEFQDLRSSPFWDWDTILSDGVQTWDVTLSGLDNEANNARVLFYGPNLTGKAYFNRFLRRLDHDPLAGFASTPPGPPDPAAVDDVVTTDLNIGEDYAIRVEQLDARFQGPLTENLKWRLNLWGMRKFGERQANANAHCFNFNAGTADPVSNTCHVLSQRQSIDWLTMEIQPAIEAQLGAVSLEYSRTMRGFTSSDQVVSRQYTQFGFTPVNNTLGPAFDYALVPDNYTQIDRLKVNAQLTDYNQLYANLFHGDTENQFRDTHRQFSGWDVRWMNTAVENVTWTAYTSMYDENNELPTTFLNAPPLSPANNYDRNSLRHPVDYQRTRAGLKGKWRPLSNDDLWRNLSVSGGYEYYLIARDFATYDSARLGIFTQPDSNLHQFELRPNMRWSSALTTYARYAAQFNRFPLIGVRESTGRLNTNQPEQSHRFDIGGTWSPTPFFVATAEFSIMNSWQHTVFARFDETNYPFNVSLWMAPTDRLSFTLGYAYFTNWIDQDIAIGFRTSPFEETQWSYAGQNQLASISSNYMLTPTVQLTCGYEWNWGSNEFAVPISPIGANWSQLPTFSDVVVITQRVNAGVDWLPAPNVTCYVRYNYFDYNDKSAQVDSGTAHMGLVGASVTF